MCSYYRRFIPNLCQIAEPIISLTRKYAHFKWSDVHQKAFQYLKDSLTCVPLLSYPDSNVSYVLYTDASDTCIGACLPQVCDGEEKPIYYLSHKLRRTQCRWSVVEKEAFAIHFSLQKLDYYLHNASFVIRTDHKVSKVAKIRNRYNQVPHLTQDTNGKVTNSQKTPQMRAKRSALKQTIKILA